MKTLCIAIFAVAIVAIGSLMFIDIPAPQTPVEKKLDAKAFLEQK